MEIEEIYRLHMNDLYRYLFSLSRNHHIAEELVQETYYRAFLHLEDYDGERVKPWLFKTGYHAFIDFTRRKKRMTFLGEELAIGKSADVSTELEVMNKLGYEQLLSLINTLPETEKQTILLCDVHDFSYEETAEILEKNLNTVKSHIHRGRKKLKQKLIERMNQDE